MAKPKHKPKLFLITLPMFKLIPKNSVPKTMPIPNHNGAKAADEKKPLMEAVEEIEANQFKEHTDNRANAHVDNVQPVKEIDYRANDHVADARIAHNVEARILYP